MTRKMMLKRILTTVIAFAVVNIAYANEQTIIHVTPQMLLTQAGIPLEWKVSYQQYDFDIENETDSAISIAIRVNSTSYSKNVNLLLSGGCGGQMLGPQGYLVCTIEPQEHLELDYNIFPVPEEEPSDYINGTYTLGKV